MKRTLIILTLAFFISSASAQTASDYYDQGNLKLNASDNTGAISAFTESIALNPNCAECYNNRGHAKYTSGHYSAALKDFKRALKINPNYTLARSNKKLAKQARNKRIGAALLIFGDALVQVGNAYSGTINYGSSSNYNYSNSASVTSGSSDCNSLQRDYDTYQKRARNEISEYATRKAQEKYGVADDEHAIRTNGSLKVSALQSLQSTQSLMRSTRERAAKNGCNINKMPEEDWRP